MAFTVSPHRSSGTPMTAASATSAMGQEHVLDLGRVDVLSTGDDHVLDAIVEVDVSLVIEVGGVSGAQPPVGARWCGPSRLPCPSTRAC